MSPSHLFLLEQFNEHIKSFLVDGEIIPDSTHLTIQLYVTLFKNARRRRRVA